MGGMMAVMMVAAGVYYMNRSAAGAPVHTTSLTGPAALAVPVASPAGG